MNRGSPPLTGEFLRRQWLWISHASGEWRLCVLANRLGSPRSVEALFRVVSRLGDGVVWYALMALLLAFGGRIGQLAALNMALVGGAAVLIYQRLKRWTRRPRPYRAHAGIVARIPPLDEFSFPSGHTLHAVSFSLVAIDWLPWLALVLVPFTLLVALSRVVLGLHYPSDVLAAGGLGTLLALLALELKPLILALL